VLLLELFYDYENEIKPIHQGIYTIIGLIIKKYELVIKREPFSADTFDSGYQEIIQINRQYGAEIYDAVKQIPAFVRIVASCKHEEIFKDIFTTELPGIAAAGYGIRIDNPHEERFRAQWHQEYLSQLRSMTGFVLWSPLVSVTTALGPVEICPGSHQNGVFPVTSNPTGNSSRPGAYGIHLLNEAQLLEKYRSVAPLPKVGDLVLLDWLVLHRSGKNSSDRSRWTMQMRYFDFAEETGISMSWCGSFAAGVNVREIHPELFVDN
jgi:hypothetical protein